MPHIRQASTDDITTLCTLDRIASHSKDRAAFIESAIGQSSCWVIEEDASIVGYAVLNYNFYDCGFVWMLYLDCEYRRKGLGCR